jgi:hypothetical protein
MLDTRTDFPPLTEEEKVAIAALKVAAREKIAGEAARVRAAYEAKLAERLIAEGASEEEAREKVATRKEGKLRPHDRLHFNDRSIGIVTVADVIADPARFDGKPLADPVEGVGYGPQTAKLYLGPDGWPWIKSFAHGECEYELRLDAATLRKLVEAADNPIQALTELGHRADLSETERNEVRVWSAPFLNIKPAGGNGAAAAPASGSNGADTARSNNGAGAPPRTISAPMTIEQMVAAAVTKGYAKPPPEITFEGVPLAIQEWLDREIAPPGLLLGHILSTTSRSLMHAATGLGKTNFGLAVAGHIGAGQDFLHWRVPRARPVLYIDGEMSRRLFRQYLADLVRRLGTVPPLLFAFSREDIEGFAPLNTREGQNAVWKLIEEVQRRSGQKLDAIIFDNIMSLLLGDMKEEDAWRDTLPMVAALTKREIGQLWEHHTGHDASRGYGTKTREWRMDTVMHLDEVKRPDTDISFHLAFPKARERTPSNRDDFAELDIALVNDQWQSSVGLEGGKTKDVQPLERKFVEALQTAVAGGGSNSTTDEVWRVECVRCGLLDPKEKPDSARSLFSKYRRILVAANWITVDGAKIWINP